MEVKGNKGRRRGIKGGEYESEDRKRDSVYVENGITQT